MNNDCVDADHTMAIGIARVAAKAARCSGLALLLTIAMGCGSDAKSTLAPDGPDGDGPSGDGPGTGPLPTTVGAHAIVFQRDEGTLTTLATPTLTTRASGSTLIVAIGRGNFYLFPNPTSLPSDNKGNTPYQQLGESHKYTAYPDSGTALYAFPGAVGGSGHIIRTSTTASEITLAAIEVAGSKVQDHKWNEVLSGKPLTSLKVSTTGPATLVAFWWGDGAAASNKTAVANNGFVVVDSVLESGNLVQGAVAVKTVADAGEYDVTWTATPRQGAQLWLVAVQ
jgi:hypothetical protein